MKHKDKHKTVVPSFTLARKNKNYGIYVHIATYHNINDREV